MSALVRVTSTSADVTPADSARAGSPTSPSSTSSPGTSADRSLRAAWAVAPATVIGFVLSLFVVDPLRAVLAALAVGGLISLVAATLTTRRARGAVAVRYAPQRLVAVGAAAGVLAAAGAALADASGSSARLAGQLVIVWFCVVKVSTISFRRVNEALDVDGEVVHRPLLRRARLVRTACLFVAATSLLALAVTDLAREAAVIAFAVPIALALFWAANSDDGLRPSRFGPVVRAALAGVTAAAFAAVDVADRVAAISLVAIALVALGSAWIMRLPPRKLDATLVSVRGRKGRALLVVLAVACGIGSGALPIVALFVALCATVVNRPGRPAPEPAPSRSTAARVVTGLTVVGFVMRMFSGRGLWLDETTSVFQSKKPFVDMIRFIGETDNHPPLHYIVLWADIRIVGDSEFALRLPMMAMAAALIPMVYLIAAELFDRRVGVYAAAITTFAPIAVWYGQEARMYSQFMLLAAISVYSLVRILRRGENRWWVLFTLSSVALVYTQYFAVLHVAATIVVLVIETFRRRRASRARTLVPGLLTSIVVQTVLIAPLVPYALAQATRNQDEGFGFSASGIAAGSEVVPPPGIYGFLTNMQWVFFGYQPDDVSIRLVALWPIGMLILLLLLGTPRRTSNRILLTIAAVPMFVVFGASFVAAQSRSLAEVRYFSGAVPVLFVLLAAGLVAIIRTPKLQYAAVATTVGLMSLALVVQQFDDDNPRLYQYEEAIEQIRTDAQPGDRVVYSPQYLNYTFDYYDPTIPTGALEDGLPPADNKSIFVVEGASFADTSTSGQEVDDAIAQLLDQGMVVEAEYDYAQITVWKMGSDS